jgi:signal transduction histidine kinase/CheY-like chemotaxis protein
MKPPGFPQKVLSRLPVGSASPAGIDEIRPVRERFLQKLLIIAVIAGLPALVAAAQEAHYLGIRDTLWLYLGLYVSIVLVTLFRKHMSYALKAFILIGAFFVLGVHNLLFFGFSGAGIHIFLLISVLMTVLLGWSAGVLSMVAGMCSILVVGFAMSTGAVGVAVDLNAITVQMISWITAAIVFVLLASAGVLIPGKLQSELVRSLEVSKQKSAELSRSNVDLQREIAERKNTEQQKERLAIQLYQSQKRESIGILAGGIAHDFNNILSAVIGFTEIAREGLPEKSKNVEYLDQVLIACDRARDLVKQILAFSRQAEIEVRPLRLEVVVKEALRMVRSSLPASIELRQGIASDLPVVMADPTQIHQIILNLCTNAAHAIEDEHGVITVELDSMNVIKNGCKENKELSLGPYVRLKISDTGVGIPMEIRDKIFDPYFTTREPGKGTGLGLAVVYGIVKDYGGAVSVESMPGRGATFNIRLPAVEEKIHGDSQPVCKTPMPMGREHILFVDDEPPIAILGKENLEQLGYKVTIRQSSVEAFELFTNDPDRFDLVVTDMTMPHMTGDELAQKMLAIRPDLPIVICTGYSKRMSEQKAGDIGIRGFIMKPLTKLDLAKTVRALLDQKPRTRNSRQSSAL